MKTELTVGERLRILRTERDLSQRALAQLANISTNSVSLIERNEISPSVATMQNLATALHVRVSYFFEDELAEESIIHVKASQRSTVGSLGVRIQSTGRRIRSRRSNLLLSVFLPTPAAANGRWCMPAMR